MDSNTLQCMGGISVEERILEIFLEEICEDEVVYEDKDINLKEEGLMDSLAFVELLVRLEEFGIEVAPAEVTYEGNDTQIKLLSTFQNVLLNLKK